ncbi:MAG: response regulator transcription factor [Anaerolineales bacterium]|nr:response regulator transcription factor [Anaerolineales bacterium]
MTTILIADDDPKIVDMLRRTLTYEGYKVVTAADGYEALVQAQSARPDVIVLDWLMPGLQGVEVARRLHAAGAARGPAILMLTAKDAIEDRVAGLDSGADDYLVKPFAPAEFLARIRALLRRKDPAGAGDQPLSFADLYLDPVTRETRRGDRRFELTPKEFELLAFLMRHPRQVVQREKLLEEVWGYDFNGNDNVLDVYIGYLRTKTEAGGETRLIQTMRGVGYVMREE